MKQRLLVPLSLMLGLHKASRTLIISGTYHNLPTRDQLVLSVAVKVFWEIIRTDQVGRNKAPRLSEVKKRSR